jgi:hypothetical protein
MMNWFPTCRSYAKTSVEVMEIMAAETTNSSTRIDNLKSLVAERKPFIMFPL